jgi:ketosteroid isomerase-like protein
MVDAFARRDADECLLHMTEDVLVRSTPYLTGQGEYRGHAAVRAGMEKMVEDFAATGKRMRLVDLAYYVDGADERRILNLAEIKIQRATGEEFGTEIAYLSIFDGDLICEVDAWLTHAEGLEQLEEPVRVD